MLDDDLFVFCDDEMDMLVRQLAVDAHDGAGSWLSSRAAHRADPGSMLLHIVKMESRVSLHSPGMTLGITSAPAARRTRPSTSRRCHHCATAAPPRGTP